MIVRARPHWLYLLFVRRGSLVHLILQQQLFVFAVACAVVAAHGQLLHWKVPLNASPFSLIGIALAIFFGFRINASYDRYWEARKLWGSILVESRNLARKASTCVAPGSGLRPFVLGIAAFAAALRNQLRGDPGLNGLGDLLPRDFAASLAGARNPANLILLWLGQRLAEERAAGRLEPILAHAMERNLDELSLAMGGCERILGTPLPFTYSVILHRSSYLYCVLLPFGLVDAIGLMTPLIVCFVSYTFFALEALSDEIEDPFGRAPNDLALDAIVAGIEASLREMLGETPAPLPKPDANYILS
ncbi:bestrophin family protein [Azonexus fungiphilus]|uniref:bestrophin family protein n=1 Tax=Azonexus fungiphilus TaxID=146940 RepID=UPI00156B5773|nr:bestrophin family ion channel [Azonexus fungiphilus]NHC05322.1 hypothetical protein [Azonexus fungiphilus]